MPNHLAGETSPYLLQHADNPVNWYPWGAEAFAAARELDRPILLSIGYAACHWCHVMAHESFEDEATAGLMNRSLRPYQSRSRRTARHRQHLHERRPSAHQPGGWPMTVFLTPDGRPFYGGTYFPPQPRYGMPSFPQLLASIADTWQTRRDEIENSASGIAEHLRQATALGGQAAAVCI